MATTTKKTTTKATTAKKTTAKKKVEPVAERSVFELMAEKFPITETEVETPVGVVKVKNRIGLNDMVFLINLIVEMCIDNTTGEVKWEFYNFASKAAICATYCGVSVPDDLEVAYAAVCGSDGMFERIKEYIDAEQLNNVLDGVEEKLDSRDAMNRSVAMSRLSEFIQHVDELMGMVSDVSEGFDGTEAIKALHNLKVLSGGE